MFLNSLISLLISTSATISMNKPVDQSPVVLELFTSQSCSSCPPADALLKRIAQNDAGVIPLSLHVDYWDYLNWKDTYSATEYTQRQRDYNNILSAGVFTPQMIINGSISALGSSESQINEAIATARQTQSEYKISITPKNNKLSVTIMALNNSVKPIDIWKIDYDKIAKTNVQAGENGGRMLESINNVTALKKLEYTNPIIIDIPASGNVAIIAQSPRMGPILGAASWHAQ